MKKQIYALKFSRCAAWALMGLTAMSVCAQSVENPIDMTYLLQNPDFEYAAEGSPANGATVRGLPYGWQHTNADELKPNAGGNLAWGITAKGQTSGTNLCWYNSTPMPNGFMLYQEVKGLAAGTYVVTCDLSAMGNDASMKTTQRLFANNVAQYYGAESDYSAAQLTDEETRTFAGHTWMADNWGNGFVLQPMSVTVEIAEGETLKLGIKTGTILYDGTIATNAAGFFKVDNFQLKCIGTSDAEAVKLAKESLKIVMDEVTSVLSTTESGTLDGQYPLGQRSALEAQMSLAEEAYKNTDVTLEALQEIHTALQTALNDYQQSMIHDTYTSLIVNNDFELAPDGTDSNGQLYRGDPYGWERTGELGGQSWGINQDNGYPGYHGLSSCWYAPQWGSIMPEFQLSQTIEADKLPAGNYELSCLMYLGDNYITTQRIFANDYSMYFGKEEDYGVNIAEGEKYSFMGLTPQTVMQEMVLPFALMEGESLTLGIRTNGKIASGTNGQNIAGWFRTDYFRLQYRGVENLSLNETAEYVNPFTKETVCNVTMQRRLTVGKWHTICLPFALNETQAACFSDIRKLSDIDGDMENVELVFSDRLTEMQAGVPYLVKVEEDIETLTFQNVLVELGADSEGAVTISSDQLQVTMTGSYSPIASLKNAYFINNNTFYYADEESDVTMNGFRAYITVSGNEMEINKMLINIDGETTGIEETLLDQDKKDFTIYNINGQMVAEDIKDLQNLPKGIYIINGTKYIKK